MRPYRPASGNCSASWAFLDPAEQSLFPGWDQATAQLVAGFRESVGTDTDDPRFVQLVGELSLSSERFRQLWARHDEQRREARPAGVPGQPGGHGDPRRDPATPGVPAT